ncbi:hypothetical protein [Bremerella alba]|nr:hypothetical protein [Bremerella alba]
MNTLKVDNGNDEYDLMFSDRDFAILGGPSMLMPEGGRFINALGVFENTSVAQNMRIPAGSHVRRRRGNLLLHARAALNYLERDADLLAYDYSFRLSKGEDRHKLKGHLGDFKIRGLFGGVDGQPRGFCTLTLSELSPNGLGRDVELIDLRKRDEMETDDCGLLKIYRTEAEFGWLSPIRGMIDFLEASDADEIVIYHS